MGASIMNKNESKYFNTAKKMNDALIILLEHKDFEYITIKDICLEANVNRSTFYLHYSNLNDLLEEVISSLSISFSKHFNSSDNISIINNNNLKDLYLIKDEYLIPYLNFIKENKRVYKAVKNYPNLFKSDATYENMFNSLFSPIMKKFGLDLKWHKYMMDFYMNGISSLILNWIFDDCKISVNEVSDFIKRLITSYDEKDN